MNTIELLKEQKAVYVKNLVSQDLLKFFTNVLMRHSVSFMNSDLRMFDVQVPTAVSVMCRETQSELMFETLLESLWPTMEEIVGEELIPTYAYARLYTNGDYLEKHTDRPACEISVTVQLGRSHHYAWPIYMGGNRVDMAEGDAVVYKGCEIEHWRNVCSGPDGYYSGQVFLHYVRVNGPYAAEHGCDATMRTLVKNMFVKNRTILMDSK